MQKTSKIGKNRELRFSFNYLDYANYENEPDIKASFKQAPYLEQSMMNEKGGLRSFQKADNGGTQLGVFMQQGLHAGLDAMSDIDIRYFDKCLTQEFAKLVVNSPHQLLYLYRHEKAFEEPAYIDTLKVIGNEVMEAKILGVKVGNNETYDQKIDFFLPITYRVILPSTRLVVLKQMKGIIISSMLTLFLLGFVLLWLILIIKRQRKIDRKKTDFMNSMTHQLKTPIAIAYAANDALLNYGLDNDEKKRKEYLTASLVQLKKLTGLVEQILSFKTKYYDE